MRLRNTIIVLILLVVLGGYSLIILLGSRPVPPPTLFNIDSKHISGIDLRYPESELELVRNPNTPGAFCSRSRPTATRCRRRPDRNNRQRAAYQDDRGATR